MASNDSNSKQWPDPKDFGLPFVEISPLSKAKTPKAATTISTPLETPAPTKVKVDSMKKVDQKKEVKKDRPLDPPKVASKKSNTWVWVVVFLGLAAISVIVWQLQSDSTVRLETAVPEEIVVAAAEVPAFEAQTRVDSVSDTLSLATVAPQTPLIEETSEAVPIATATFNLIPITFKGEKKRFFLVIASFPKESTIQEFIQQLPSKPENLYLISPYETSPNYRLAVGMFDNWTAASVELEKFKSQFTYDLWILNY